ncbi:MAG: carbon starvation protein A [Planctomycetota bacterium]
MLVLLIAVAVGFAFVVAYHTYGRWLGEKVFRLSASVVCPSYQHEDGQDYVPTSKSVVFGHHFTSIAGTGPIVGPAIAVMWGWLPALLWVVFGSIFIGAVHDFGALVVSLRNNGQTVGEVSGRLLNKRVRLLFLLVLFLALTIVLAIFGLVIAAVFKQYPAAIFPCLVQIPLAVAIGLWLHRKGVSLLIPSLLALGVMYLTVVFGNQGWLGEFNAYLAELDTITWVGVLLVYSYVASVLPVWTLLQPRDFINSLQLISALGLIVVGLCVAAFVGGAPPVEGAERQPLEFAAPMVQWDPADAPLIFPFLFITIACGAISGLHCLVSSGTSSKQLKNERDAQFVGFGSMLTEGFLATLVILACCAGLGLGTPLSTRLGPTFGTGAPEAPTELTTWTYETPNGDVHSVSKFERGSRYFGSTAEESELALSMTSPTLDERTGAIIGAGEFNEGGVAFVGATAWESRYSSWSASNALASKVGAFVDGAANFLISMGISSAIAVALMGVLVASFAGTTLDTACRLQRYVVQELAKTLMPKAVDGIGGLDKAADPIPPMVSAALMNPLTWLTNKHGATIFAVIVGGLIAAMPAPGAAWSVENAGKGGLILWPMFGATNQLLGGLAFLVITFYLWRRGKAVWFVAIPLVFMLIVPAWAMAMQLRQWFVADTINIPLIVIAVATVLLEAWMLVEAALLFPKVRGVVEAGGEGFAEPG